MTSDARNMNRRTSKRSSKGALVKGVSTRLPIDLLQEPTFKQGLQDITRGYSGIYLLYGRETLYYIGLANNLYWRLMKRLVVGLFLGMAACTPSALQLAELRPVHDSTVMTAADLFASADSATKAKAPADAAQILIVHGDSVIGAIAIYELPDMFWADIYVHNGGSQPYTVNPSQLILMDGVRTVFRPLRPDEAANIYVAKMTGVPPYQPKYIYDVQSSTQGYLYAYGNYGYYNGTTQTTVTQREDPYNALGYSIGAAIARHRNAKLGNMASTLYTIGFVEGSSVPAKTGARGGVYWLKRVAWSGPLVLRFVQSGYEARFTTAQP